MLAFQTTSPLIAAGLFRFDWDETALSARD